MRGGTENALAIGFGRNARVEQQTALEGEDRTPVFHRAEELAAPRSGDVVELRQRIRHAEVVVVLTQHRARGIECELRLRGQALLRDHAKLDAFGTCRRPLEVAEAEEQQVGRHPRRSREAHALPAVAEILALADRHVADRHLRRRHDRGEIESRLVGRFVPAWNEPACIGILELRVERASRAIRGDVVEGEQAVGLGADAAAVGQAQPVAAGGQGFGKREARGLRRGIDTDLRIAVDALLHCRVQVGRRELQVDRIQGDAVGRLEHLERNRDLAIEFERLCVRLDLDFVVQWAHVARQLGRRRRVGDRQRRARRLR